MKNVIIIIPARIKSTRLPGKPLKIINNKPLIYWTWKNCSKAIAANKIFVATDSKKIIQVCNQFGIQSIMTSSSCLTGTDRVAEAASKIPGEIFSKYNIYTKAFDLRGFGKNKNSGLWFPLNVHMKDIKNELFKIKSIYPKKKNILTG